MKSLLIAACIGAAVQWVIDWVLPALDKDGPEPKERIPTPPRTWEGYQPKGPLDGTPPDQGSSVQPMKKPAKPLQPDAADFIERYLRRLVKSGIIDDYEFECDELFAFDEAVMRVPKCVGIASGDMNKGWHYLKSPKDDLPEEIANLTALVVHCQYRKKDETK